MQNEFIVTLPENIVETQFGIKFYDKTKTIDIKANNIKEVYLLYPTALKINEKK